MNLTPIKRSLSFVFESIKAAISHFGLIPFVVLGMFGAIYGAFKIHNKTVTAPVIERTDLGEIIDMVPTGPENNRLQIRTSSGIYSTGIYYGRSVLSGSRLVYVKRSSNYEEYQIESPSK